MFVSGSGKSGKMTTLLHSLFDGYHDLMDNKSGECGV